MGTTTVFHKTAIVIFFLLNCLSAIAQQTVVDSILSDGIYRNYRLYIPKSYTSTGKYPLVFNLHGYTSTAQQQQSYSNFDAIADTAGFLVLYAQGTISNGNTYWNAGMSNAGAKDVAFISNLIDHVNAHYSIDLDRVYSCGMSMGGFMSHTLACSLSNRIAAIASVTGSIFVSQYNDCDPQRAVPVMQISGTADNIVPYAGNTTAPAMMPIDSVVNYWVKHDQCNPTPVFTKVPDINVTDGCTAEHYLYSGGTDGSTCEFYKIIGGGHAWPGVWPLIPLQTSNQDFNASIKIWLFFKKYKLPHPSSVDDELITEDRVNISPNPTSDIIRINTNAAIDRIKLFDATGRLVLDTPYKNQVSIAFLPQGIYSLILTNTKSRIVKKVVRF